MISTNYNTSSPSFGAYRVGEIVVQKLSKDGIHYFPTEVNVVELNPRYVPDLKLLERTTDAWARKNGGHFASNIYGDAYKIAKNIDQGEDPQFVFAVTSESVEKGKKIKKLDPQKILGLATWTEKRGKYNYLSWIQGNPAFNHYAKGPHQYNEVGKRFFKFIRKFGEKPLEFVSARDSAPFYENMGCYRPFDTSKYFMRSD